MLTLGQVKFRAERFLIKGSITQEADRLIIEFPFNGFIKDEVKAMDGVRWHGFDKTRPRKVWSVKDCRRNRFQLDYLTGGDPYRRYNIPLVDILPKRKECYKHQVRMFQHFITRRHCMTAAEMGTGKTLAAIEAMEWALERGWDSFLWVGTNSSIASVKREFYKWGCRIWPQFINYDSLTKLMAGWPSGKPAFRTVIFDESSKVKNYTAQRSQAAYAVAEAMRDEYEDDSLIILMSGSPAPKDPTNWFWQAEIACPGFIREGNTVKFRDRLGLLKDKDGFDGGTYKALETWWDDDRKCAVCGKLEDHENHDDINRMEDWYHRWVKSKNEVEFLYKRMSGLVEVMFKRACLDLPEKQYRKFICKPTQSVLNAAKIVQATADTTIRALTLLRELSDGFQYKEIETGTEQCAVCHGSKAEDQVYDLDRPDELLDRLSIEKGRRVLYNDDNVQIGISDEPLKLGTRKVVCTRCRGTGQVPTYTRETIQVPCPKEDALLQLLEEYEEEGRVVIFAGFTGSVERCSKICMKAGWEVIRVDGRGWWSLIQGSSDELLRVFDEDKVEHPKLAFIGQPGAAGMGLNLTASSVEIYYSNTFNGEDRIQSEDRIHRPGADHNRGVTIWDLVHLPSDQMVLDNIQKKRDLQSMTMGLLRETLNSIKLEDERVL